MKLVINGLEKEFEGKLNLKEIINRLNIEDRVMAAAVNMNIVKKDEWDRFTPNDGDKIELLEFVGGG
jgi:sulfur carrier protein